MKITNNYDIYSYQQQIINKKSADFAALLAVSMNSINNNSSNSLPANTVSTNRSTDAAVFEKTSYQVAPIQNDNFDMAHVEKTAMRFFDHGNKVLGIDTTRKINWESKGDKVLTDEQITELKEKYNIEKMSAQDSYNLKCDLTEMGVLSGHDILMGFVGTSPMSMTTITPAGEKESSGYSPIGYDEKTSMTNFMESSSAKINRIQFEYEYIMKLNQQPTLESWDKDNVENYLKRLPLINDANASAEKCVNIYSMMARDSIK